MKVLKIVFGIIMVIMGFAMMATTWYFFYQEETAIIQLASLYNALSISAIVSLIGAWFIVKKEIF